MRLCMGKLQHHIGLFQRSHGQLRDVYLEGSRDDRCHLLPVEKLLPEEEAIEVNRHVDADEVTHGRVTCGLRKGVRQAVEQFLSQFVVVLVECAKVSDGLVFIGMQLAAGWSAVHLPLNALQLNVVVEEMLENEMF